MKREYRHEFDEEYDRDLNYKHKGWLGLVFSIIIFCFLLYEVVNLSLYTVGKIDDEHLYIYKFARQFASRVIPEPTLTTKKNIVKYAGLSDIYLTPNMLAGAKKIDGTYDFSDGLESVIAKLDDYDLVTASLNTPIASKDLLYSTIKYYNCPTEILDTLKRLNISMVAGATYHINDKESEGLVQTIQNLEQQEIKYTGISKTNEIKPIVIEENDITFGFLSYTETSNEEDEESNINFFDKDKISKDMKYLAKKDVDFTICYLNFVNDSESITSEQKQMIETLFNSGVEIVLCTGNKKIQSSTEDILEYKGNTNHIYSIYSMGNFMGAYNNENALVSCMANITFSKEISTDSKGNVKKVVKEYKVDTPTAFYTDVSTNFEKEVYIVNETNDSSSSNSSIYDEEISEEFTQINQQLKRLFE